MLLTEFINNTEPTHPDYKDLTDSLNLMKKVAEQINKAMSENENKRKCIDLQKIFTEPVELVEAHREFVYEGDLTKQCRKARKLRRLWLFNDILLYGKPFPATGKFKLSGIIKLENFVVKDIEDNLEINIENALELTSTSKSFVIYASTPLEKTIWLKHFHNQSENLSKRRKTFVQLSDTVMTEFDQAPVWQPDERFDHCPFCKARFTLLFRKHHCRKCGSLVCDTCSKGKMIVLNVSPSEVRVCDNCLKTKNEEEV